MAIAPRPHTIDRIIHVRLPVRGMGEKIAALESKWKQTFPDFGFDYWFVDEEFGRMYENQTPLTFTVFAGAVGLIALVTAITVGYESLRASLANPVKTLRQE